MIRLVSSLLSMAFRTLLICCAVYVYMEAANPVLARKVNAIPYIDLPVFAAADRHWDRLIDAAGLHRDWAPLWAQTTRALRGARARRESAA